MRPAQIGDIIESRADGSYIYMSHKGVLNLDDWRDLAEAEEEDSSFLDSLPRNKEIWL